MSSYERDPELGPGYAYLVAWGKYKEFLSRFSEQREVCSVCHWKPYLEADTLCADEHLQWARRS